MTQTQKSVSLGTTNTADDVINVIDLVTITSNVEGSIYTNSVTFDNAFSVTPTLIGAGINNDGVSPMSVLLSPTVMTFSVLTGTANGFANGEGVEVIATLKGRLA